MSRAWPVTAAVTFALVAAAAAPVRADDPVGDDDGDGGAEPRLIQGGADPAPAGEPRGDHRHQFGLGLSLVTGYRFISTYDNDRFCGDRATAGDGGGNAAYCFARTPFAFDVSLSYGLTPAVELMLDLRIGVERDFGSTSTAEGPRLRHYAPGVRFFLAGRGQVNYFSTAQLAIDATGYRDVGGADLGTDVRLRNANGLQVDFHDAYGVYVYFAEEVAFRRWLEVGIEGGAGIQARYP